MIMDWKGLNKNKIKIWLEAGLALLLVIVIGVAGHNGAFTKKEAKAGQEKSTKEETLNKAVKENEAAKSGKNGGASEADEKKDTNKTAQDQPSRIRKKARRRRRLLPRGSIQLWERVRLPWSRW